MILTPVQEKFDYLVKFFTLVAGVVSFVAIAVKKNNFRDLTNVWNGALAGAGIVTGLAVVICAFVGSLVPVLADMPLYLGITGLSLVLLSVITIRDAWEAAGTKSGKNNSGGKAQEVAQENQAPNKSR